MAGEMTIDSAVKTSIDILLSIYNWLTNLVSQILQQTIIKDDPSIAREYGSAIAILVSLTTIYLLLVLVSLFRKILGVIIAIGWVLLIAAMILRALTTQK